MRERGALTLLSDAATYAVTGSFDPVETMRRFSDAIEQALADGFRGFRAAANMSWALAVPGAQDRVIEYEVLLRSLFSTARATGLCLYDVSRMPAAIIDGAMAAHPLMRGASTFEMNPHYREG